MENFGETEEGKQFLEHLRSSSLGSADPANYFLPIPPGNLSVRAEQDGQTACYFPIISDMQLRSTCAYSSLRSSIWVRFTN